MEEKVRRESKVYVEKLFKQIDTEGCGAIHRDEMEKLVKTLIPEFKDTEELEELLLQHARRNKYTKLNPSTKQMEITYMDDTVDFPSCLAMVVHFLAKHERKQSDAFMGQGLIKVEAMRRSSLMPEQVNQGKKRLY